MTQDDHILKLKRRSQPFNIGQNGFKPQIFCPQFPLWLDKSSVISKYPLIFLFDV